MGKFCVISEISDVQALRKMELSAMSGQQQELSPIQLPSVSDVIYGILKEQILSGTFAPGSQLNLNQLEKQLDVSRTPLKAALARLQSEGLVEIHARRGTFITEFERRDIQECFEMRIALEAQALQHAFEHRNQQVVHQLIQQLQHMDKMLQSDKTWLQELPDFMDMDREFHLQLVGLSGNRRMREAYEKANVQGYIAIMGTRFHFEDTIKTQNEHRAILDALQNGDSPALLKASRVHLEGAGARALMRLTGSEVDDA
jgi:DNA-binding GntR family transcriptional regulator